ncbi:type 2 isopentenyl-diphosphate Delta-isomerase [Lactobacillus sp. DCY120]|uniref:Isopentenyl-diphosphate delta-isomerase n=1 Tax=Bombilactobacillus apium TaxID=2675299 RepID=A0A850R8U6_9LACO|nr:type 2 isopentenyl-diphosphate Delta-isomerase [Bombilactobacillus apium]NVY95826.1 type 2 isopentenyl-diphosphate Delta-isomerase [Bombilactobacillus apium]
MPQQPLDWQRKLEHVFLAEKYYQATNPEWQRMRIDPVTLPNLAIKEVDLRTSFFSNFTANAPIYINAMTGGAPQVKNLNAQLGALAAQLNLPIAVGSMSNYLKYPQNQDVIDSYTVVRKANPQGMVWANLSAKASWQEAQRCIDLIQADALQVHLNPAQELVMAEGHQDFRWQENLRVLCQKIAVPIIIKEVGFGMTGKTVTQLTELGAQVVDVSGVGGTNFAQIENERNPEHDYSYLQDWGWTTLESLLDLPTLPLTSQIWASGGIRTPLDALKSLILGAQAVGLAAPFLHTVQHHDLATAVTIWQTWLQQLQELVGLVGCRQVSELTQVTYQIRA